MSGPADIQAALSQLRAHPPVARAVGSTPQFKDLPPFTVFSQTVNEFTANQKIDGNFFGLKLPLTLNYPGTQFEISLDGAEPITVQTGDEIIGSFGRAEVLSVSVTPQVPDAGLVVGAEQIGIVLYRRPDVFWIETADANSFPYSGAIQRVGPNGSVTQAYNSLVNTPVLVTDGVDSAKAKSVKVIVSTNGNGTITGGTIRLWQNVALTPSAGVWAKSAVSETLATGAAYAISSDFPVSVPGTYYYAELVSATNSSLAGSFLVFLQFGYEP